MGQPDPKTCPRCRAKFECGLANGRDTCWCFDCPRVLPVVEEANCLCPDCLRAEIADRAASRAEDPFPSEASDP